MSWTFSQMKPSLRANWWWLLPSFGASVVVLWIIGPGWGLVVFSAALVLATLVLAFQTAGLARANKSLAENQIRAEIRDAISAAKEFVEIDPVAFVDVVKGPGVGHPWFNAIDTLARYGNVLHDKDSVRDVQQLAAQIDNVKIKNAQIRPDEAKDMLTKLQQRVLQELVELRQDLRHVSS